MTIEIAHLPIKTVFPYFLYVYQRVTLMNHQIWRHLIFRQTQLVSFSYLDENGPVMDGSPRNGSKRWCPGMFSGYPNTTRYVPCQQHKAPEPKQLSITQLYMNINYRCPRPSLNQWNHPKNQRKIRQVATVVRRRRASTSSAPEIWRDYWTRWWSGQFFSRLAPMSFVVLDAWKKGGVHKY